MGDVALICAHKNKRTSSKPFRYGIKLIELYTVVEKLLKKVLFLRQHKSWQRPPTCPHHTKYR